MMQDYEKNTVDTNDDLTSLWTSLKPYSYKELRQDPYEIRLVAILPGDEVDPICCRILTVGITRSPRYTAISYTWATEDGEATQSHPIFVTDTERHEDIEVVHVTKNCANVLRMLRSVTEERTIWMDSICINQSSASERTQQVRLMDRIYDIAWSVEICIYDPQNDYSSAMELLKGDKTKDDTSDLRAMAPEEFRQDPRIVQLVALCGLRYFTRVW